MKRFGPAPGVLSADSRDSRQSFRRLRSAAWGASPPCAPGRRLAVERLEGRVLMSAAPGLAAGSLDPTFGGHRGAAAYDIGAFHESAGNAVALLPGNKFAVVGQFNGELGVARFNPDGSLDNTFGGGSGFVATAVDSSHDNAAEALVALPGGKLLVAGQTDGIIDHATSVFALARYNADGSLDKSFGNGGVVTTSIGGGPDAVAAVAPLAGGKFLVAGTAKTPSGLAFATVRYFANGTVDKTFADAGVALTHFTGGAVATSVAVAPDGSVYVAGASQPDPEEENPFNNSDFALARYTANGLADKTFGNGGQVTTDFHGLADQADVISLGAGGKITLGGTATTLVNEGRGGDEFFLNFGLARYNANGSLDKTFHAQGTLDTQDPVQVVAPGPGGGFLVVDNSQQGRFQIDQYGADGSLVKPLTVRDFGDASHVNAVAVAAGGKVLAVGTAAQGFNTVLAIGRYNPDGSSDTSFGPPNGFAADAIGAFRAEAVGSDGSILAGGSAQTADFRIAFAVARYTPAGIPDASFGGGRGFASADFGGASDAELEAVAALPGGKFLAAGRIDFPSRGSTFGVARFNADGSLDKSFGNGGEVITPVTNNDNAAALALLPGGKFVVAGSGSIGHSRGFATVRYYANGTVDKTFGNGGVALTHFPGVDSAAVALAVLPNGKLLEAGAIGSNFGAARYNADGSLDTSFGAGKGFVTTAFPGSISFANALSLAPGGKFVLAGAAGSGGPGLLEQNNFAAARYNADGSLDKTFGPRSATGAGTVTTGFPPDPFFGGPAGGIASAVAVEPDGKVVAAGVSTSEGSNSIPTLVRYNPDGSLDAGFGRGGRVLTDVGFDENGGFVAVALQPAGKILVAGDVGLVRYVG